ncbi:NAD(P)/FAD-dependent oxidoreductase [Cellulomonas sp. SG140]|uniref:NAD(P)/FAD-dependent oxidoreductase n=1 Tax=Cellulomonas sp. SG140 TaxID=2976536 RepID=UPI0021E761EE|nr:FAD-dependent oxidoreductase [Cellulomonas sp. SG140]
MRSNPAAREVLVVGAGLAATRTVAELRTAGFDGSIHVLGAEGVPPYDRPPLSKHLLDRTAPAWLTDELGVDVAALADRVELDRPARALLLDEPGRPGVDTDTGPVHADHVVLATGAHAVRPPAWGSARTLHTAGDADQLRAALADGGPLVVIGAGWIGAEVAGVVAASGSPVTVVEAADAPLSAALGTRVGALTAPWYAAAGVELLTGASVAAVEDGGVRLADGRRLPAATVLAAVGARPATGWLGDTLPRDASGAVRVDERYRVLADHRPVPGLWAVGDVAVRRSARHGWVPGGHWEAALRGPEALARHLVALDGAGVGSGGHRADEPSPDDPALTDPALGDPAPEVFSTQLGHDLVLLGQPGAADEVVVRGDPTASAGWSVLWLAGDRVTAVLVVDRHREVGPARRAFGGAELPRVDAAAAADPDVPLRTLLSRTPAA